MKKEMFIAIFLGLSLGLIVTYGIYTARKTFISSSINQNTTGTPSPTPGSSSLNSLVILSPEDETIQSTKDLKVTGTTDPKSQVVIMINNKPIVTEADVSGNFAVQSEVESGGNIITVRAIDQEGNVAEEERTVIFSTVALEQAPVASASPSPSASPKASTKPRTSTATKSGTPR